MSQTKRASTTKRSIKTVSVLGVAGATLAASASGSSAGMMVPNIAPSAHGPYFGEEEISDISLATFHVTNPGQSQSLPPGILLAHGHGHGHGGHGCHRGCGCGRGCGGGWGWGCGGCCLSWGGCRPWC